ncbi:MULTISPECIES: TetR/AcrR family transcriptional regulator [Pectobacterium]|uniref:TetR/AcrR family transcriptional regulator n=1 Tax=Pectobacterium aquaticum TaxID=2204145 RepID=A0AA93AQB6_9GAMM|nr:MULTISPECIES: TetR/AcrR family transcriptional regulator [Pectobacterium]MBA0173805.1 TetR/AcrR family transcriptional regulator [Pectobacterium versatile]QQG27678.1 TetR/AcrR family transcriptional regulator [Pectobacterium carotovorum]RRO05161.1 TetR/AcrR family transcriptional regulator [Pectobacterium aquaticum]RRO25330.1 TetR/AcrR family transcriptional regulator [Pectobacterium aquaticum]
MARSSSITRPRKLPVQERSRLTVDAIIQASAYILNESGWEGLTTNSIAERAGVNISSLYQFFPNKEAIINELQRRHALEIHSDLHNTLKLFREKSSLREALTLVIEMVVNKHRVAPAVHKAVTEEIPLTVRRVLEDDEEELSKMFLDALKPFMKNVPDPEFAIYIVGIVTHAVIHRITVERPQLLEVPLLVTELVTLFEYYLCRTNRVD